MTLDEVFDMWREDAKIDSSELGSEALRIPQLHHKYLRMLSHQRVAVKRMTAELESLRIRKTRFYQDGPDEETRSLGWTMPPKGRILKTEAKQWVDADPDVLAMGNRLADQAEVVEALVDIVKSINNRNFVIKNSIEWLRFTNGG